MPKCCSSLGVFFSVHEGKTIECDANTSDCDYVTIYFEKETLNLDALIYCDFTPNEVSGFYCYHNDFIDYGDGDFNKIIQIEINI